MAAAPSTTTDLITVRIVNDAVGDFSWIPPQHMQRHLRDALEAGVYKDPQEMQDDLDGGTIEALATVAHATCHVGAAAKQLAEDADSHAATERMGRESMSLFMAHVFAEQGQDIMVVDTVMAVMALGVDDFDPFAAEDEMSAGR